MRLYLVRHAEVVVRADVTTSQWELSAAGTEAARTLARSPVWQALAAVASSPEPKALATARPIADAAKRALRIEPALREVDRGATAVMDRAAYRALIAAHFADRVDGWEHARDASARIAACIERLVAESDGPLCVVSHGLVLSHYIAGLRGSSPDIDEWSAMPMPAIAVVDPRARQVLQPFMSLDGFL